MVVKSYDIHCPDCRKKGSTTIMGNVKIDDKKHDSRVASDVDSFNILRCVSCTNKMKKQKEMDALGIRIGNCPDPDCMGYGLPMDIIESVPTNYYRCSICNKEYK